VRTETSAPKKATALRTVAVAALLAFASRGRGQAPAPLDGAALMKESKFQEALPLLESEAAADPGRVKTAVALVTCLIRLGRWNDALAASDRAEDRFPTDAEVGILRADCLFLTFQPARAVEAYRPYLSDPRWGSVAVAKAASAAMARGDRKLALALFDRVRELGVPLADPALEVEYGVEEDLTRKLDIAKHLAAHSPGNAELQGLVALDQALASKPPQRNLPPGGYPSRTKIREILREPSLPVKLLDKRRTAWLAFDTGSESLLLNEDVVKDLGLPELAKTAYGGWGDKGLQETRSVYIGRLEVAGRVLTSLPAIVNTRDTEIWTRKGGYIGLWPFLDDAVLYDRRGGVFALYPSGTPPSEIMGDGSVALSALWHRGLCLIPVAINGGEPHPFLLDTGAPYTILDRELVARLGVRVNSGKYGNVHGLGFSGAFSSSMAEGVVIDLALHPFPRRVILVTDIPQHFPVPVYGIVGRDLLNEFRMVFDGPGATVTFKAY